MIRGDGCSLHIGGINGYPPGHSEHDRSNDVCRLYLGTRFKERL